MHTDTRVAGGLGVDADSSTPTGVRASGRIISTRLVITLDIRRQEADHLSALIENDEDEQSDGNGGLDEDEDDNTDHEGEHDEEDDGGIYKDWNLRVLRSRAINFGFLS